MADTAQQKNKKTKRSIIIILLIITIIIILLLLMRCGAKKALKPVVEEEKEQTVEVAKKVSTGFVDVEDKTITPELKTLFDKATSNSTIKYEAIELIAKQENEDSVDYKFLAQESTNNGDQDPDKRQKFIIIVREEFGGDVSLTEVETIIEPEEDVPNKKTIVVDDGKATTTYYLVVFRDQYGNELQRSALPYGAIPSYNGWLPERFDHWDKEIGPVTGNVNYYAVCYEKHHSEPSVEPTTPVTPVVPVDDGFYTDSLYSKTYGGGYIIDAVFTSYKDTNPNSKFNNYMIAFLSMGAPAQEDRSAPVFHAAAGTSRDYLRCAYEVNNSTDPKTITLYTDSSKIPSENASNKKFTIEIGDKMKLKDFPSSGEDLEFNQPETQYQHFFTVSQDGYGYIENEMVWLFFNDHNTLISGTDTVKKIGYIPNRAGERFTRYTNSIQNLTIGPSIEEIGTNAFLGINMLQTLTFTESSDLKIIGSGAFSGCFGETASATVIFPSSLSTIADRAFCDCTNLVNIGLNEGLTSIGPEAFNGCTGLTSITIPSTVTSIGDNAFYGVGTLASLTFADTPTIRVIGSSAFQDKSSSVELTIPTSVTSLGLKCFYQFNSDKLEIPETGFPTQWTLYKYIETPGTKIRQLDKIADYNLSDDNQKSDFIKGLIGDPNFSHDGQFADGCFQVTGAQPLH